MATCCFGRDCGSEFDSSLIGLKRDLAGVLMHSFGFMLGELEISNLTAGFLGFVALVFVISFGVVSLQTGELIKPPKKK